MRYVGLLPHPGEFERYGPDFAKDIIGKAMPYREYPGGPVIDPQVGRVTAARVDDEGVHLEIEVERDNPVGEKLRDLAIFGSTHGLAVGHGEFTAEPDPLLRIGCVQPPAALDSHENRDMLREIVKAALRRFEEEHRGDATSPDASGSPRHRGGPDGEA